jgi:hypothetical protein
MCAGRCPTSTRFALRQRDCGRRAQRPAHAPSGPRPVLHRRRRTWASEVARPNPQRRHIPRRPGGDLHRRQRPPCPITEARTLDTLWIPTTAANDLLIITRDSNIAVNRAEIAAVRESVARMVALAGKEAIGTWAQLEVLMTRWRSIEALLDEPGPFIYFGHSDSAAAHRPWVVACVGQSAKKLPGRGNGSSKEKPSAHAHPLTSSPSEVAPSSNGAHVREIVEALDKRCSAALTGFRS